MKNKYIFLILLSSFSLGLSAQTVNFSWNGATKYRDGSIQTWTVPACVTSITITAVGASGGESTTYLYQGGHGASITGTLAVTPGHVLNIMVGGRGDSNTNDGSGGGGGTFIWDASNPTQPLIVAGGGGGGGCTGAPATTVGSNGADGQTNTTSVATLEAPTLSTVNSCGLGGFGGGVYSGGDSGHTTSGGPANTSNGGPGSGGAGWGNNGDTVTAGTFHYTKGGGLNPFNVTTAGYGGAYYGGSGGYGGYGGGGGGGFNGAGGGGGYNGGGGGNGQSTPCEAGWGGGGGGSYFNGTLPTSTALGALHSNGSVSITPNCVLPVQLLTFTAAYNAGNTAVDLNWSTATETNNKLFTIERSADGENWETVTTVPGAGNSNHILNYSALDESPLQGISYYRLKQTDYDGSESYSSPKSIDIASHYSANLFPNPTSGNMTLNYSTQDEDPIIICIIDISGRVMAQYTIDQVQEGTNSFHINANSFSKGLYFMKITNSQKTFCLKFEKE